MLQRFFRLQEAIYDFMKGKVDTTIDELKNDEWIRDLAFLSDMCEHLNQLNLRLQSRDQNIVNMFNIVKSIVAKLELFKSHLQEKTSFSSHAQDVFSILWRLT
ncbi:hypothetical protein C0J52_22822 [Blattella germanica]|nr:hypothetical protein C0J52_22822 [Blattella germanica]